MPKFELYRIDDLKGLRNQPTRTGFRIKDADWSVWKMADFADEHDCKQVAHLLAGVNVFDYCICERGRVTHYMPSMRIMKCGHCGATFRRAEVIGRKQWGTVRCDCGALNEIEWEFQGETCKVLDYSSPERFAQASR